MNQCHHGDQVNRDPATTPQRPDNDAENEWVPSHADPALKTVLAVGSLVMVGLCVWLWWVLLR